MDTKVKMALTQGSITFLFFSGFLLGVAATAVTLLGSQIPLKCFEAGNAADWLAAIGTWVIGFGAISLAMGDRRLKLRERQEQRVLQLEENLEEVQRVALSAQSASTEFQDAAGTLEREFRLARYTGFSGSVALPHVRRTAYVLAWTPAQLRLLPPVASSLASDVNARAERIISRSDEVGGTGDVLERIDAAIALNGALNDIQPLLSDLKVAAMAEVDSIRQTIQRIQQRLNKEIDQGDG